MKCETCGAPFQRRNKATVIKVDGTEIALPTRPSLTEAQRIVGGYIQLLHVPHGLTLVVDEEGKLKGKPRNVRASDYYQFGDLVGDVIVLEGWRTVG